MQFNTPVACVIFNRPGHAQQLLEAIRPARPTTLFVIADGPRSDSADDVSLCEASRAVFEQVDWPCKVHRRFLKENLGCGLGPSSGITWVFSEVDRAIILEDDCLPDPSFFQFADEVLKRYENDSKIMHVSGSSYIPEKLCPDSSYYFSRYAFIWGWATWARAWKLYDFNLKGIELELPKILKSLKLVGRAQKEFYPGHLARLRSGDMDFWDVQWCLTCLRYSGLSITPKYNLIRNIGFGPDSTHTKDRDSVLANRETRHLNETIHPGSLQANDFADRYSMAYLLPRRPWLRATVDSLRTIKQKMS